MVRMTEEDLNALRAAAATLEHPSLAARLGNIAGKPIELLGRALPEAASKAVAAATTKALEAALVVALRRCGSGHLVGLRNVRTTQTCLPFSHSHFGIYCPRLVIHIRCALRVARWRKGRQVSKATRVLR
jgi:hypothetical protein